VKKRSTIKDISREIGVSVTTVYKALNNKPKISEEMRRRIAEKAKELNYTPNKLAQGLARGVCNLGLVIPSGPEEFFRYVKAGIDESVHELMDYNIHCIVKEVVTEREAREAVKSLLEAEVAGIIVEPNAVIGGVYKNIDDPSALQIPVISFVSDPIDGTPIIGVLRSDGYVLGRTAAQLLYNCAGAGEVAVFWPEGQTLIHRECAGGFMEECERRGMDFLSCFDITNDQETAFQRTGEILRDHPGLKGIYVASYNAVGVCRKLEEAGRTDIKVVGQDLYPELAACIERGSLEATLFQNQYSLAKEAISAMVKYITEKKEPIGTRYQRPEVVMRSNLECYIGMY
jgi:LacI family transcriptional regulator